MKNYYTTIKLILVPILCFCLNSGYSQTGNYCDDFTTYNFQPNGDTLGYTQGGSYEIIDVPYFDTSSTPGAWYFNQNDPGMYGSEAGAQFSFNGSYQTITYEIYGFYGQFGQMGFSVNGSSPMAFNGSFPVSIGGVFVNLDTNATDFANWENVYLSFSGNVNEIKIYAFESGIIEMCIDSVTEDECDHFNSSNWQPADTLGYTQGGTYPVVNVPYFGTGTATTSGWSQGFFGMYGSNCGAQFSFDGSNQSVTYEVYGLNSQFNQVGFSVNGSSATALNVTFPVIVNGITVNLDTSAIDFPNWENVYLSFTGNVNEVEIYFFESGIVQMCADSLIVINSISKFSDINSVLIYPNPATEKVTIENKGITGQNVVLSLMNMQGQAIVSERVNFTATHTLDVSDVSSGIYMLTLRNDKMFYQNRIVIQK